MKVSGLFGVVFSLLVLPLGSSAFAEQADFQVKYFDLTDGRVAFSYVEGSKRDIYVLDFHALNVVPLVTSDGVDEAPSWSPDGKQLVFHSDMSGNTEIYIVNSDGRDLIQLTNSPGSDENPQFTPDGKQIIFQSARGGKGDDIYIMNIDGSKQTPIIGGNAEGRKNVTPRVSPRGTELAYVTNSEWPGWDIAILDLKSKESKVLTQGLGSYIRPAWKADGSSFSFSYGVGQDVDIWYAEKGKAQPAPLVRREGRDLDPCYDDKGEVLFFAGELVAGQGDFQLFMYNPKRTAQKGDAGDPKIVHVMLSKGSIRHPSWTPFPTLESLVERLKNKGVKTRNGDKPAVPGNGSVR